MFKSYYHFILYVNAILIVFVISSHHFANAQCSALSRPTLEYTFGNGTPQFNQLEAEDFGFTTTYLQEKGNTEIYTNDGEFSFVNLVSDPWGVWHEGITDHTGDGNGYMMLVNADYDAGQFYKDTVEGLCTGVHYEFSVWLGNIDENNGGRIKPNVRFEIRNAYNDNLLAEYETGDLPVMPNFTWEKHAVEFDATTDKVVLLLINNNPGGNGNDLVLDDVAFTPCLPVYDITGDTVLCIGENLDLGASLLASSYATPEYLWQKKNPTNNEWEDLIIANNLAIPAIDQADSGWYRLLVAEMGSMISGVHCRSIDSVFIHVVSPLIPGKIAASQNICFNTSPSLFISEEDASSTSETLTYQWETSTDLATWTDANSTASTFQEATLITNQYYRRKAFTTCYTAFSDTILVTVYDSLTNNVVGDNQVVCGKATPSPVNISTSLTGGKGVYAYQWQRSSDSLTWSDLAGETGITYQSPTISNDTYLRIAANDSCGIRYSNVIKLDYQFTAMPDSIHDTICEGSPLPPLTVAGTDIQWYDNSLTPITPPTFNNTSLGTQRFHVTETLLGCESKLSPITLTVHSTPTLTLTSQATCEGDSAQFIPTINGGTPQYNFNWFTGSGSLLNSDSILNVKAQSTTFYSLAIRDQNECTDSNTVPLTVYNKPILTLNDTSICAGETINLLPRINNATAPITYDWSNSTGSFATTPSIAFNKLTTEKVGLVISDANNCKDTTEITVTVNQRPQISLKDTSMCEGAAVTLTPSVTNATAGGGYQWYNPTTTVISNSPTINYDGAMNTNFSVVFEDANSCKDTAQATVTVNSKPEVTLSDVAICEEATVTITPTITDANGTIMYVWENLTDLSISTAATLDFSDSSSTNYELRITDGNECKDTATVQITVFEKPAISITGNDVCSGNASTLKATVSNYSTGLVYNWTPSTGLSNTTSPSVNASPSNTTKYLLTVTTADNCVDTMSHVVGVTSTPIASILGEDTILCKGENVTYSAFNDATENYTSEWYYSENDTLNFSPLATKGNLTIGTQGFYRILVRNGGFCPVWSDIIFVKKENIEVALTSEKEGINGGESIKIEAITTPDVLESVWSTGAINTSDITVSPEEKTTYFIEVRGEKCTASDLLTIEVYPPIIIPNGFSPNGDGKNDRWYIKGIAYFPTAEIKIYNRWGNIVYHYTSGYDEPWNGIDLSGSELPIATYYYVIDVNDTKNQKFNGSVSILR